MDTKNRAGQYIHQPEGYKAFIPAPLPPNPPIEYDSELITLLSKADRALGRLDSVCDLVPNLDLFVHMYVRKEAVLSSQIEGTQSTFEEVIEYEAGINPKSLTGDMQENQNHILALEYGLKRIHDLPVSLRLIQEIHGKLMEGVRGGEKTPGEFRRSQNWIGPKGASLQEAAFIPPPVHAMNSALDDFERFLHRDDPIPPLVLCGIAHAQFETIHPFLDGNGRIGRLLITFLLCQQEILTRPLLYLSHYFKKHRQEYYERLMAIRENGDWENWLKFFLKGIAEVSLQATTKARKILNMIEQHNTAIQKTFTNSGNGFRLLESLLLSPVTYAKKVEELIGCSNATAHNILGQATRAGILKQISSGKRNRLYLYKPYMDLLRDD